MRFGRYALLLFGAALWIWMGASIAVHTPKKIVKATIIQSSKPIRQLDDPVRVRKKEILWFDKIYFPRGNELKNPVYGYLGYTHDFLILFDTDMVLDSDKYVRFVVYSDDGFRLSLDGKTLMEYPGDRPYSKSETIVPVTKGRHHLRIKYFQGYGQLGISALYGVGDTKEEAIAAKLHFIGIDNDGVRFIEQ